MKYKIPIKNKNFEKRRKSLVSCLVADVKIQNWNIFDKEIWNSKRYYKSVMRFVQSDDFSDKDDKIFNLISSQNITPTLKM